MIFSQGNSPKWRMKGGEVDSPTLAHLLLATAFVYERAATTKCIFIYEIQAFRPG